MRRIKNLNAEGAENLPVSLRVLRDLCVALLYLP